MRTKIRIPIEEIEKNTFDIIFGIPDLMKTIYERTGWNKQEIAKFIGKSSSQLRRMANGSTLSSNSASMLNLIGIYQFALTCPEPKPKYKVTRVIGGKCVKEADET